MSCGDYFLTLECIRIKAECFRRGPTCVLYLYHVIDVRIFIFLRGGKKTRIHSRNTSQLYSNNNNNNNITL